MNIVCGKGLTGTENRNMLTSFLTLDNSVLFYDRKNGKTIGYRNRMQEKDAVFYSGIFLDSDVGNPINYPNERIKCRHGPAAVCCKR